MTISIIIIIGILHYTFFSLQFVIYFILYVIYQKDNTTVYNKLGKGFYLNFWYFLIALADIINKLFYSYIFYY